MELGATWRALKREPWSFWFLCLYLMVEYVRPQQIWRAIDVFPFGEVTLILTAVAYLVEGAEGRKTHFMDRLLLGFTVVLVLSGVFAWDPGQSLQWWDLFFNWLVVYFFVTHMVTTPRRFFIFWGFFLLWSLKMSQHGTRIFIERGFAFASWGASGAPGWFQNSGEFAIQMCIFLPMSLHMVLALRHRMPRPRMWFYLAILPGTAFISLVASSSRGGQIGAVAVLLFMVLQSRHKVRGIVVSAVVLAGLWLVMPPEQKLRFQEMGEDQNSQTRLTYWEDGIEIFKANPVLGIGYKNWLPYYRRYYNPSGELPHNIFVEAGSEMGILGLAAFLSLIGGTFVMNRRTRRMAERLPDWGPYLKGAAFGLDGALVGFLATGFFVTVLFYPFFWVNLAFTAALYQVTRGRARDMAKLMRIKRPSRGPPRVAPATPVPAGTS